MLSNTFFFCLFFLILLILRQLLDSRSIFIKKHDSGINLLISHLARWRVENIEFQLIRPPILCQCAAVKAQRRRRSTHCDHDEESKHHAQHDVQIIGQASSPQRTQNGGQASDGASHTLAEPCRHSSQMQSSFWVVVFFVLFYFSLIALHLPTLRFLCRDFGEERHLGHSHEGEPQQLQEHPDDEGRQLPPVAPWQVWRDGKCQRKKHQSFSIPANRNLTLIAASNE